MYPHVRHVPTCETCILPPFCRARAFLLRLSCALYCTVAYVDPTRIRTAAAAALHAERAIGCGARSPSHDAGDPTGLAKPKHGGQHRSRCTLVAAVDGVLALAAESTHWRLEPSRVVAEGLVLQCRQHARAALHDF
eukprot:6214491-Pleurochrysis_carterae.AAC.5